jgi:hypothetical protein
MARAVIFRIRNPATSFQLVAWLNQRCCDARRIYWLRNEDLAEDTGAGIVSRLIESFKR